MNKMVSIFDYMNYREFLSEAYKKRELPIQLFPTVLLKNNRVEAVFNSKMGGVLKMNYLNTKGWNTMLKMVYFITVFLVTTVMSDVLLKKIKDETIKCDYLVVCPETMVKPAVKLAEHRNAFAGDKVENAQVISLEDIVIEFTGTDFRKRNETLWYAVKWAKEHWMDTLRYLVLIGDDQSKVDTTDSTAYSIGVMPTWYSKNKVEKAGTMWRSEISDDIYCTLSLNEPPSSLEYFDPSNL
jgi:hypothetical protein